MFRIIFPVLFGATILTACTQSADDNQIQESPELAPKPATDHSQIVVGNGENNFIELEGAKRDAATFTFPKVVITKPGFLVMHPFRDGAPVQDEYVGAEPIGAGAHADVSITIETEPASGDMFIVMLHYDVNEDEVFDFGDGKTVPDAPVFEGNKLIALRFEAP